MLSALNVFLDEAELLAPIPVVFFLDMVNSRKQNEKDQVLSDTRHRTQMKN